MRGAYNPKTVSEALHRETQTTDYDLCVILEVTMNLKNFFLRGGLSLLNARCISSTETNFKAETVKRAHK